MIRRVLIAFLISAPLFSTRALAGDEELYAETFRPQYHFSPRKGWIGDPCGLIRYRNQYHLFWWGHAVSNDLVHWKEQPYPMVGGDGSFAYFSGSAVVDHFNSAGFGTKADPALIAIYTAHNKTTGIESQCISYSTDGQTFKYWTGNPVLDEQSKSFRDPDVFWHAPTKRWIMAITAPERRVVRFYASPDLKSWKFLSEFGPVGAQSQIWEVPNLFQMTADDGKKKWILMCGMGPNRMQYFVGEFDGVRFTMDPKCDAYLTRGIGVDGKVFADFERGYGGWRTEGDAFGNKPASPAAIVIGSLGQGFASSRPSGEAATGKLISPEFKIANNCINFLLAGGRFPDQTCINLVIDGKIVQSITGSGDGVMRWNGWDVSKWKGQTAHIEIIDNHKGAGGQISVDHIVFSDTLHNTEDEQANWIDFGPDFYAARTFRNFDEEKMPITCIGWMGNWQYARSVPTSWGHGAQSIPRTFELIGTPTGYAISQSPLAALERLRSKLVTVEPMKLNGSIPLKEFQPTKNCYELDVTFDVESPDAEVGLNLCLSADRDQKLVVGYNAATSNVYVDRRKSGKTDFSPHFSQIFIAPIFEKSKTIRFRIFIDQSSVEVFVNDGQVVLTALVFPDPSQTGIEFFGLGNLTGLRSFRAWELMSIW